MKYRLVMNVCMNQNAQYIYDYVNSNYTEDAVNWKFIINYIFMLNEAVTAWILKKQHTVLIFTIKAEYIVLRHNVK